MSKRSAYSFSAVPTVSRPRNVFDLSHGNSFTLNVGDLIPYDVQEVIPGDTHPQKHSFVFRTITGFQKPILDNLRVDQFAFYVPYRLLMDDFEQMYGGSEPGDYIEPPNVSVPQVELPTDHDISDTIADYLCLPAVALSGGEKRTVSALPFRAIARIYNEYFRNENVIQSTFYPMYQGSSPDAKIPMLNTDPWSETNYLGKPPKIARLKDQFTSCLPRPQKGDPVSVPISGAGDGYIPVISRADAGLKVRQAYYNSLAKSDATGDPKTWTQEEILNNALQLAILDENANLLPDPSNSIVQDIRLYYGGAAYGNLGCETYPSDLAYPVNPPNVLTPANLVADLSNEQLGTLVNDIRTAFQIQRILERSSRCGTRYTEYLYAAYGIKAPDQRLQRAEYLGGASTPMHLMQVAQTSPGTDTDSSFVGDLSAYSLTNGFLNFKKSFVEPGLIICFMAIRQNHIYSQGIENFWTRKTRFDFYDPALSHISEQPVYTDELMVNANKAQKEEVFGYNEAWVDLRYRPSHVSGRLRPEVEGNVGYWSAADFYENEPSLNRDFIEETPVFVDRCLQVPSTLAPQFLCSVWIENHAIRQLPLYSTPELVDHF